MKATQTFLGAALALTLASNAYAENKIFFGASALGGFMEGSSDFYNNQGIEIDNIDGDVNLSGFGGSARAGYEIYFKDNQALRIYAEYIGASFTQSDVLGKSFLSHYGFNADYRYDFESGFSLFAGVGGAASVGKTKLGNIKQLGAGLNLGAAYRLTPYVELELRGKMIISDYFNNKAVTPPTSNNANVASQSFDLDAPMYFMAGVNFRF